jgi:hypothetical protein
MFKILGVDDSVNSCECCGKSNLKSTVIVEINGSVFHYGSVCATRHTGMNDKELKHAIKDEIAARKESMERHFRLTSEFIAAYVKEREATKLGLVGLAFRNYCRAEQDLSIQKYIELKKEYGFEENIS